MFEGEPLCFFLADGFCFQVFVSGGKLEMVVFFSLIYSDEDRVDVFKGVVFLFQEGNGGIVLLQVTLLKALEGPRIPIGVFLDLQNSKGQTIGFCFLFERSLSGISTWKKNSV